MAQISPYYRPAPTQYTNQDVDDYFGIGGQQPQQKGGTGNFSAPQYAQAALGAANMAGNWIGMAKQGANLPGAPTQNGGYQGQYWNQINNFDPQKTTGSEVLSGAAQGAAAGAALGPLGMGIGAAIGAGGTIIAGRSRRNRQQRELDTALSEANAYQSQYNTNQASNYEARIAAQDYQQRLNNW